MRYLNSGLSQFGARLLRCVMQYNDETKL